PVLVGLELLALRELTQLDVVGLGSREILQRRAVGGGLDGPQVDLQPATQLDRRAGLALRDYLRHLAVRDESIHHAGAVAPPRGDEDVQVPDRLAAAAVAPRHLDLPHATAVLDVGHDRVGLRFGLVQQHAALGYLRLPQAG